MLGNQRQDIAGGHLGIHAQQEVGSRQIEEAQCVRLHNLGAMDELAQQFRRRGNADRHDGIAGLRRRQLMADRADAANARSDPRHFVIGTAFGELFETADLGDMELGAA